MGINRLRGYDSQVVVESFEADENLPEGQAVACADCGNVAKFKITEKDGDVWHYCGICEVGG